MKWIAIIWITMMSTLSADAASPCQQAKELLKSVKQKHRSGYSIKESATLDCLKRYARQAITQHCRVAKPTGQDALNVSRLAKQQCSKKH